MKLKKILGEFLIVSRAERNASLVLLVLLFILILLRFIIIPCIKNTDESYLNEIEAKIEQFETDRDSLYENLNEERTCAAFEKRSAKNETVKNKKEIIEKSSSAITYFPFDPNSIAYNDLLKLGIPTKVARVFISYRKSGAQFRQPEDLLRVYGFDSILFSRLKPYVKIERNIDANDYNAKPKREYRKPLTLEINSADSASWVTLPGIGSVFAKRICNFRGYLGGFVSVGQIAEVYNLPEETFQRISHYLTVDTTTVRKIALNFADVSEFARHPYCNFDVAKKIVGFRTANGNFVTVEQLASDSVISMSDYKRFSPYLYVD